MSTVKILYNNQVRKIGVTILGSSEAESMPADNIAVAHPSEPWRVTTLSGANVQISLPSPEGYAWDAAAVLYSTLTPYRNQLKHAGTAWSTYPAIWELSGLTSVAEDVATLPLTQRTGPLANARWQKFTEDTSNGEHFISQDMTVPFGGSAGATFYFTASFYLAYQSSDRDLRLQIDDGAGTPSSYVRVDFDVSTETLGSITSAGYTGIDAVLGDVLDSGSGISVRRITLTGSCAGTETLLRFRLQLLSSGSSSYIGTTGTGYVAGPMVEYRATSTYALSANVSEFDSPTSAGGGCWSLGIWDQAGFPSTPDYEARLLHCTPGMASTGRSDLMEADLGYLHSWFEVSEISAVPYPWVQLSFNDPDNAAGTLDVGVVAIGTLFTPSVPITSGSLSLRWVEVGDELQARGGQAYRPVNRRKRQLRFTLSWLNKAEAYGDILALQRMVGRSEPVLVILNSDEADYPQEVTIYAFLDDLGEVRHRQVETYEHAFSFTEILP
jgi:hypothetical protein